MDLCGPMRVQSIKGKKYILVIVDDYSRFIWVKFLRSKDETPEFVTNFLKQIQVLHNFIKSSVFRELLNKMALLKDVIFVPPGYIFVYNNCQDARNKCSSSIDIHLPVPHQEIAEEHIQEDTPIIPDVLHPSHNLVTGDPVWELATSPKSMLWLSLSSGSYKVKMDEYGDVLKTQCSVSCNKVSSGGWYDFEESFAPVCTDSRPSEYSLPMRQPMNLDHLPKDCQKLLFECDRSLWAKAGTRALGYDTSQSSKKDNAIVITALADARIMRDVQDSDENILHQSITKRPGRISSSTPRHEVLTPVLSKSSRRREWE
ncbi:retrovirus-related pol polyprotein from transposon TNT 1-94 [Tanacetum coccineum]